MRYSSTQSGFSLVEALVAITILLIVIAGPMTISSSTAKSTSFSSEQVVASFLAQEGAEIAQKVREEMIMNSFDIAAGGSGSSDPNLPDSWSTFVNGTLLSPCFQPAGCGLELVTDASGSIRTSGGSVYDCTNTNACRLRFNGTPGERAQYTYVDGGNTITPYTRVITMQEIVAGEEIHVTSRVFWRTGSQRAVQEVIVETYLFNIYGN